MSPDQVRAEELGARSDLFSFGAAIYEMTRGRRAFAGDSVGAKLDAHQLGRVGTEVFDIQIVRILFVEGDSSQADQ